MHVQLKSNIAPPNFDPSEGNLFLSLRGCVATCKRSHWIYEPASKTEPESVSMEIPEWLKDDYTVFAHDEELSQYHLAKIICSPSGSPLPAYFIPTEDMRRRLSRVYAESPCALFSLSTRYIKISFNCDLFTLRIEELFPLVVPSSSGSGNTAMINKTDLYNGTIRCATVFCNDCKKTIPLPEAEDHRLGKHGNSFSFNQLFRFSEAAELKNSNLSIFSRALRAAYKKAKHNIAAPSFIAERPK